MEKIDELNNLVSTIDVLINEISDETYIEELKETKSRAEEELGELLEEVDTEYEVELRQANKEFEDDRLN